MTTFPVEGTCTLDSEGKLSFELQESGQAGKMMEVREQIGFHATTRVATITPGIRDRTLVIKL
jgi:hypothetical protein